MPRIRRLLLFPILVVILVSVRDLAQHTDSVATFANSLTLLWMILVLAALLTGRRLGLTSLMITGWVILGVLRSVVSLGGVPTGWIVTQSIEAQGRFSSSQTHVGELSFGAGEVPAHLINDSSKFNFYSARDESEPDRAKLPVVVMARAFVAGEGELIIFSSSPIRVTVGTEVTELRPPIVNFGRRISVSREEAVEIVTEPTGVDKTALAVRPVGLTLYSEPTTGPWMTARRWLGGASGVLNALVFLGSLWVVARVVWRRLMGLDRQSALVAGLVGLVVFLSITPYLLTWLFQHDSLMVLSGGDDWLTYETLARDIRHNSVLMLADRPLGQGQPFYYQALYPYAVALGHLALGESVQGIVLAQLISVVAVVVLAFRALPRGIYPAAALALALLGTGVVQEWSLQARNLLSENLLMLIFVLIIFVTSKLRPVPSLQSLALVGLLLGIGGVTRSTVWLAAPFIVVFLCRSVGRARLLTSLAAILVPMALVALLIPARNLVVSGNPAWLPTNGSITLAMGNVPPGRKIQTEPWLEFSKRYDPSLVAVVEAAVNAPEQVGTKIVSKAIYVLGFPKSMDSDHPWVFWPVLSLWLLAPLGLLTKRHSRLEWVCLILALTHAIALVIVHPHYYFYRLEMPATLPLAIWDAIALGRLFQGLPDPSWMGNRVGRLVEN